MRPGADFTCSAKGLFLCVSVGNVVGEHPELRRAQLHGVAAILLVIALVAASRILR
jgi:hypothetical protein